MKKAFLALCASIFAAVAGGETVEISTSGWCGSGARRKWSFHGLGPTTGAAELKTGAWINSPRWPEANVLSAAITLACSTNEPTRFLQIKFLYDDGKPVGPVKFDAVPRAGTFETQVSGWDTSSRRFLATSFRAKSSITSGCEAVRPRTTRNSVFAQQTLSPNATSAGKLTSTQQ